MIKIKKKGFEVELEIFDGSNNKITVKIDEEEMYILRNKLDRILIEIGKNKIKAL